MLRRRLLVAFGLVVLLVAALVWLSVPDLETIEPDRVSRHHRDRERHPDDPVAATPPASTARSRAALTPRASARRPSSRSSTSWRASRIARSPPDSPGASMPRPESIPPRYGSRTPTPTSTTTPSPTCAPCHSRSNPPAARGRTSPPTTRRRSRSTTRTRLRRRSRSSPHRAWPPASGRCRSETSCPSAGPPCSAQRQEHQALLAYQKRRYWSTVPFRHGPTDVIKYSATPCVGNPAADLEQYDPNTLQDELVRHLETDSTMSCFDFGLQFLDTQAMTSLGKAPGRKLLDRERQRRVEGIAGAVSHRGAAHARRRSRSCPPRPARPGIST